MVRHRYGNMAQALVNLGGARCDRRHGSKAASAIGKRSDGDAMHTAKAAASAANEVLQEGGGEVSQARLNKW